MAMTVDSDVLVSSPGQDHVGYRLAPGTELLGEYQDSGFRTPKYLLSRADGQVMQLPLPLYRLAASLDGRDAERIATDLSAELGQELTADQVSSLIEEHLRPVGVVAPDDELDGPDAAGPPVVSDPLLALRYRVGVLPAAVSWRVAGLFRPFFLRPVWMAALTAFAVVLVLIVARGDLLGQVLAGVDQLVHAPLLLLLIYVLTIAAGTFHEFGHVTACRYGGARPGDMGIGLYIVWPAFYSTVTDAYRLNRVGRLRTDLGGVYFNAVFMAGLGSLYLYTEQPWVLIALLGMLGETLWQFLPSIRLDGYYVLADLVGVPDLFGYLGPALTRLLPGRPTHPKVRELRPWARRLIVTWVALVVPTLLCYFVAFLILLPSVLPVVWQAFLDYLDTLDAALRSGDVVTSAVGVFQLLLLVLPWVGAVLMTGLIGGQLRRAAVARWGWAWAQPGAWTGVRRVAARTAVGGLAVALVWRVALVATSAPPSAAEARISSSAFGVLHVGRDAAPDVAAGEWVVREQLVAFARATGSFDRHGNVLTGGRELAVVSCVVLVGCLLTVARVAGWRPWTVALPLVSVAAMGPAVTTLARVDPAVVGATWTAVGVTSLVLGLRRPHGRHRRRRGSTPRPAWVVAGVGAVFVGVATAPLTAVPLAVGAVVVILRGGRHPHHVPEWAGLVLGAIGATVLAARTAPALLGSPGTPLPGGEREVLLLVGALVAAGALVVRRGDAVAATGGAVVALAALPAPGADAVLPLLVVSSAALGALVVCTLTREPVSARPHPLLRAALAVPVLVLVVVGALLLPTRAVDPPHRGLAAWLTDPASPAETLTAPAAVWADLLRDGVPVDRLRLPGGEAPGRTSPPDPGEWTVAVGAPGSGPSVRFVFGSGSSALTVLAPG
jgi:putative peptide zinc metalloprotease protein